MITAEQALREINTSPDFEEIQNLDINYAVFRKTIRELLQAEENGTADSGSADMTIGQAIEDHAQNQLDIFDLDVEVEIDPDASAASELGAAIAEILSSEYEFPEEGISELSQIAEMTPDEITECILGQAIPTMESCEAIADHYLGEDEAAYEEFLLLAQEAHEELSDEPVEMGAEVDSLRAEFNTKLSAMQQEQDALRELQTVGIRLRQVERRANELLNSNTITPAEYNSLIGSQDFRQDQDSVAYFCEFCAANQTNPHVYLDRVEFCLNWKMQSGPSNYGAFFTQMADEPADGAAQRSQESQDFVKEYRSRNGYQ